jgi:hypothetical protein
VTAQKLPKVNIRPMAENSPNLVTLSAWQKGAQKH